MYKNFPFSFSGNNKCYVQGPGLLQYTYVMLFTKASPPIQQHDYFVHKWESLFCFIKLNNILCERTQFDVLMTNEMHNSHNQFLFHSFLSAVHVSKESSRSSSGARHNILYYSLVQSVQSCYQASPCISFVGH